MYTSNSNNTTVLGRDPMFRLEQEMKIRNFSKKTIKSYLYYNKELLRFASLKSPLEITKKDIKDYLEYLYDSGRSTSTVNLTINALKFYYEGLLHRKFFISEAGIKRPKKEKRLPVVLSKEEIIRMISAVNNLKHKLIIQILYSTGMRISELRNLQINHVDFNRRSVLVRQGKGKKDRITVISDTVLRNIEKYLKEFQPLKYIFESYKPEHKITVRSLQKVVTEIAQKVRIKKKVTAHTLRHSFATHMLENNVNLRYIQAMLGHARLETTQIYTRVAINKFNETGDFL